MLGFVDLHLFDDGTTPGVSFGQFLQMPVEMRFDLTLGFGEKTEVPFITQHAGDESHAECAAEPQGVQQAFATAEFADALLAPGEVVGFFLGGLFEFGTNGARSSSCFLSSAATWASASTIPCLAAYFSKTVSGCLKEARSWRSQMERTLDGETNIPRWRSSLLTRPGRGQVAQ